MTSRTQGTVIDKKVVALGIVGVSTWLVSVVVPDATPLGTVGRFIGMGIMLPAGAYLVWRPYRLNVLEATQTNSMAEGHDRTRESEPGHERGTGGWLRQVSGAKWFMRYTNTDLKLFWTWVLVAVFPFVFQRGGRVRIPGPGTVPFPWYAFPVLAVVGFYLSHRVFVGPLTTSAEGDNDRSA